MIIIILAIISIVVFYYAMKSDGVYKIPYLLTVAISIVLAPYLTLPIIIFGAMWVMGD